MIKLPYVVRDAEKCSTSCTFCLSILLHNGCFPQDNQWILLLYSILYDNYETNLLCLDCRIENNMKMSNFFSTESPWSAGKRVTLPQCESQNTIEKATMTMVTNGNDYVEIIYNTEIMSVIC